METEICIIGAGPAGMTAAIFAAQSGAITTVIEGNTTPGRKLMLTGGGRCNLTHNVSGTELVRTFGSVQGRFLSYCLYEFSPHKVLEFFASLGLKIRTEQDGCVFPSSNHAGDVRDVLVNRAKKLGVNFLYDKRAGKITKKEGTFIINTPKEPVRAEKVIIATGGLSWPKTGCTGDGYRFARSFGHNITQTRASLVPLVSLEDWPGQLAGTPVENVRISARINNKKVATAGALIFTDDGIYIFHGSGDIGDIGIADSECLDALELRVIGNVIANEFIQKQIDSRLPGDVGEPPFEVGKIWIGFVRIHQKLIESGIRDGFLCLGDLGLE